MASRERARGVGARFDLRAYNDMVLASGRPLPMEVLEVVAARRAGA